MLYVGSARGIETTLVPEAGFDLEVLPGRGIARKLTVANIGAVLGLLRAFGQALRVMRRDRPAVVVSLGGYASVPCALWAVLLRVPIVVAEQNAVPGLANRLIGRFAKVCATSFPDVDLPKAVWTGNPVRAAVRAVDRTGGRTKARAVLGIDADRFVLAVFGGSLGARRINDAVLDAVDEWRGRGDLSVRHIVGKRDYESVVDRSPVQPGDLLDYQIVEYENNMPAVYAAADMMVCRSGATTVAELAVTGSPSLLVPLPGAPGDHQTMNARGLVDASAAILVPDHEMSGERVVAVIDALVSDPDRLASMASGAQALGRPDAASAVAELVVANAARPVPK